MFFKTYFPEPTGDFISHKSPCMRISGLCTPSTLDFGINSTSNPFSVRRSTVAYAVKVGSQVGWVSGKYSEIITG